ncbi:MAG: hypothetical protein JWO80_3187 [Bryobacterales bacterium]|nr:hypothetical protein [Bryobacterales bacterium]
MTPKHTITIVCLANSRKHSGRCVAGKEFSGGRAGCWIRPVSRLDLQELSEEDMRYENGEYPKLLDVIQIPVTEEAPVGCQTENWIIDPLFYWVRTGRAGWQEAHGAVDSVPANLWINGFSSIHGMNDRFPEDRARELSGSLLLVQPEGMMIRVGVEGAAHKRKVRGEFLHNARRYQLAVTDPEVESAFLAKHDGEYSILDDCVLTLSISLPFEGFCYKLIAAVITDVRA